MALTDEEKATLDALIAKEKEEDDDENEPVEVWEKDGSGARLPYKRSKGWLESHGFIPKAAQPADSGDDTGDKGTQKSGGTRKPATRPGTAQRYFGKRPAGK